MASAVSRVSAAGSTRRKRRPSASNVDTPSVVSSRYCVSSGPSGSMSWYMNSVIRRTLADTVAGMRVEHDTMGEVLVPDDARWGAQTQRAVDNFPISGERIARDLIGALASIKGASATINGRLGVLDKDMAKAIHDAAADVSRGPYDDQFPIDVFQTGSGTSSNMNMNEVVAALASE